MATQTKKRSSSKSIKRRAGRSSTKSIAESAGEAVGGIWNNLGRILVGDIHVEFMTLHDFFVAELQDLFSAEQQLLDALSEMAKASTSRSLRKAFLTHRRETAGHVKRLRKVFQLIDVRPEEKTCKAMKGLLAEGDEWIHENAEPGVKDVGLIAAAQRVEHYEMAGYGCVRTYAELLGHAQAAKLLQATLDEEGAADQKLTDLASRLNVRAAPEPVENNAKPRRKAR